jgi:hypothetical protein
MRAVAVTAQPRHPGDEHGRLPAHAAGGGRGGEVCRLVSGHSNGSLRVWAPELSGVEEHVVRGALPLPHEQPEQLHELHAYVTPDGPRHRLLTCAKYASAVVYDLGQAPPRPSAIRSALKVG